jgi:aspartate racemase
MGRSGKTVISVGRIGMKTVGMVGGIAPDSTIQYYRLIVAEYRKRKPDGSYPAILMNSIDMTRMLDFIGANNLAGLSIYLAEEVEKLRQAGAASALFASNTPHIVFEMCGEGFPFPCSA